MRFSRRGKYAYDCDGNMTTRDIGSGNPTLTYNAENQLYQYRQGEHGTGDLHLQTRGWDAGEEGGGPANRRSTCSHATRRT